MKENLLEACASGDTATRPEPTAKIRGALRQKALSALRNAADDPSDPATPRFFRLHDPERPTADPSRVTLMASTGEDDEGSV